MIEARVLSACLRWFSLASQHFSAGLLTFLCCLSSLNLSHALLLSPRSAQLSLQYHPSRHLSFILIKRGGKKTMVVSSGTNSFAKEMAIRKRIGNIFNKREEDFPSLKDYNDYLEEVEDMTCSLIEGIDVAVIEAKIAKYQEENAEQIINSRARKAEELAEALRLSKLSNHALAEATDAASGSQVGGVGGAGLYAPAMTGAAFGQPRPMGMIPQLQPVPVGGGHDLPDDEESQKLRAERGGRAGGWTIELSRRRAFEEAFSSMWI